VFKRVITRTNLYIPLSPLSLPIVNAFGCGLSGVRYRSQTIFFALLSKRKNIVAIAGRVLYV
jgi:hypothetical protein